MGKRVGGFVGICFAFYAITAVVALGVWGTSALCQSSSAFILCLLPTLITLIWAEWAARQSPLHQLFVVVGGMLLRMGVVMGLGLLLSLINIDELREAGKDSLLPWLVASYIDVLRVPSKYPFWIWILVYYLFTLLVEIALVMRAQGATTPPLQGASG